jgi:NMD protein affecting ribosome stability and mRNA decay
MGKVKPCVYCGVPAEAIDHIPPKAYRQFIANQGLGKRYPTIEVETCHECNSLLGVRKLWTVPDRKRFIKGALRHRYAKYLRIPDWDPEELRKIQRGFMLSFIETGLVIRDITRKRISW